MADATAPVDGLEAPAPAGEDAAMDEEQAVRGTRERERAAAAACARQRPPPPPLPTRLRPVSLPLSHTPIPRPQELEAMKARLAAMEKEQAALRGGEEVSGRRD